MSYVPHTGILNNVPETCKFGKLKSDKSLYFVIIDNQYFLENMVRLLLMIISKSPPFNPRQSSAHKRNETNAKKRNVKVRYFLIFSVMLVCLSLRF